MFRIFRIAFSLRITYKTNTILYSLKQLPLIGKRLPDALYCSRGLKIFATVLAGIWEFFSMFLGKFFYMLLMVVAPIGILADSRSVSEADVFLHILLFLTVVGAMINNKLLDATSDRYYAIILMRMDARAFALTDYLYTMGKVIVGFLPFTVLLGILSGVPLRLCLLLPFSIAAAKTVGSWLELVRYRRTGVCAAGNGPKWYLYMRVAVIAFLLFAAYGLLFLGVVVPRRAVAVIAIAVLFPAAFAAVQIWRFDGWLLMYKQLFVDARSDLDSTEALKDIEQEASRSYISEDAHITSNKKGFEYFNELFIRRHKKALWRPARIIAAVIFAIAIVVFLVSRAGDGSAQEINKDIRVFLPNLMFIMYLINRGRTFTQVLFTNCDHSMLTYSFYRQPRNILRLFAIRLREIVKINLLPAVVLAASLAALLLFSGGAENPLYYVMIPAAVLSMSVFFSVHHLTLYYLLQPYTAESEVKSLPYSIADWGTYAVCFFIMDMDFSGDAVTFGLIATLFCIAYCLLACVLVYKFAHKTFRLRG